MPRYAAICFICLFMLVSLSAFNAYGADVETAGDLKVSGGIIFSDDSVQTSACTGCADGILSIRLGGTGGNTASAARENLSVPGLITPNTFTASQTIQGDVSIGGNLILPATTSSTGIIKAGGANLIHTFGSGTNFFAGIYAGNLTMSGGHNTATGYIALASNTSGSRNTAFGSQALYTNTSGLDNAAFGGGALYHNTTGKFNTATGTNALYNAITVDDNTAVGTYTLYNNTTGSNNTATGSHALLGNTEGYNNTANGAYALLQNTTGNNNTAIGSDALKSNTNGTVNTATGSTALMSNTTGTYNTATGYSALAINTFGNSNTANGIQALYNNNGSNNTAMGRNALLLNNVGNYNSAFGYVAGDSYAGGHQNTFIGAYSDASIDGLTNATAIGYGASVNASNKVRIGNTGVTVIEGQVAMTTPSDFRLKKEIEDVAFGLDFIKSLRPVQFTMKEGNGRTDFGFIAQDIEAILGDDYNVLGIGADKERTLSLRYTDFIAPMVKAIQEQQGIIEAQKRQIETLEERISRLETLVGDQHD